MKWNILVGSLVLGFGLCTQSFGLDLLDRMLGTNYNGCCEKVTCCDTPCDDPGPSCGCETGCDACCVPCKPKCRRTPLLDLLRGCKKCKKSSCDGNCCEQNCCEDPGCGCEDPGCGCEVGCEKSCCKKCRRTPLLNLFRKLHAKKHCCAKSCCEPNCCEEPVCGCEDPGCGCEDPACGCEATCCEVKCGKKRCRVGLLDRIFGKRCCKKNCGDCCEVTCGCEDPGCGCEDPGCGCEPTCGGEKAAAPADEPKEAEPEQKDEVGPAPVVDPSAFLPTQRRFIQTTLVR